MRNHLLSSFGGTYILSSFWGIISSIHPEKQIPSSHLKAFTSSSHPRNHLFPRSKEFIPSPILRNHFLSLLRWTLILSAFKETQILSSSSGTFPLVITRNPFPLIIMIIHFPSLFWGTHFNLLYHLFLRNHFLSLFWRTHFLSLFRGSDSVS